MPNWTDADRELEAAKLDLLAKNSSEWADAAVEGILDFFGISIIREYLATQQKTAWDHFLALLVAGAWLEALYFILKFFYTLLKTRSGRAAITAIIGEEGMKAFMKKVGKSWLFWLLILDLLLVIAKVVEKAISSNDRLRESLRVLYLTSDAPNRDEVFRANGMSIPTGE